MSASTGSSWVLDNWRWLRTLWESYEPGNALDVLVKDVRAVLDLGESRRLELPMTEAALARVLDACVPGYPSRK